MSRTTQSAPKRHQAAALVPQRKKDGPSRASASTHLSKPHPYGARPSGNALLASATEARVRPLGLGKLACIHDDVLLEVLLPLLATRELGAMTLASRALYCFGKGCNLLMYYIKKEKASKAYEVYTVRMLDI